MSEQLIANLLSSVIGGLIGVCGARAMYSKQNKDREKTASGILYFELRYVEYYFKHERSSLNLRGFKEWQKAVITCSFLNEKQIEFICYIFKNVDIFYEEFYDAKKNGTGGKDNLNSTMHIKNRMFKKSDNGQYTENYTEDYKLVLDVLKKHMSKYGDKVKKF